MCEENAQNCEDQVIGFSIMTAPQLTQLTYVCVYVCMNVCIYECVYVCM